MLQDVDGIEESESHAAARVPRMVDFTAVLLERCAGGQLTSLSTLRVKRTRCGCPGCSHDPPRPGPSQGCAANLITLSSLWPLRSV